MRAVSAEELPFATSTNLLIGNKEADIPTAELVNTQRLKPLKFREPRPRASTLPSLLSASTIAESDSSATGEYSDSLHYDDRSMSSIRADFEDDDEDDDFYHSEDNSDVEDTSDSSHEHPFAEGTYEDHLDDATDSDDEHLQPPFSTKPSDINSTHFHNRIASKNNGLGLLEPPAHLEGIPLLSVSEHEDTRTPLLSGLSEEDLSDMEEDLELAARQIKLKISSSTDTFDNSPSSATRLTSATSSPRHTPNSSSLKNSIGKKSVLADRSNDAYSISANISPVSPYNRKSPRQMSVPPKPYSHLPGNGSLTPPTNPVASISHCRKSVPDLTINRSSRRRPTDPGPSLTTPPPSTHSINSSPRSNELSKVYSEAKLAAQEKFEIGLGLREPSANIPRSSSSKSLKFKTERSMGLGPIVKQQIGPMNTRSSLLSSQIKDKQSGVDNPLEEFVNSSGKAERQPLRIKMYMPSSDEPRKPWEVVVRLDVNVHNTIGFALYCYMEDKRTPTLADTLCNPNKWTLRIVEDDGEPDEDFPALDRTRMISAYSFDEFALVEATPSQVLEHEKITPSTKRTKQPVNNVMEISKDEPRNIPGQVNSPEVVVLRVYQYPFDEMVSRIYWTAEISVQSTIDDVTYQICMEKGLDPSQYVCKLPGQRSIIKDGTKIKSLDEGQQHNLELTPKRIVNNLNGYSEQLRVNDSLPMMKNKYPSSGLLAPAPAGSRRTSTSARRPSGSLFRTSIEEQLSSSRISLSSSRHTHKTVAHSNDVLPSNSSEKPRPNSLTRFSRTGTPTTNPNMPSINTPFLFPEALNSILGYQKYKIWRRQPMSFISRHERVLALDGEHIHIMPSDDRAWYDYSPKTSSFHISQMVKCKQSRKIPTNFKVSIMKTNPVVMKRYDLEAKSAPEAQEIVAKLNGLFNSYTVTKDSSRRN